MARRRWRIAWLCALSCGTLLQSTCDAIEETIRLALDIVNVWV